MISSRKPINFEIHRTNTEKNGMKTTASKFYPVSNLIGLNMLNLEDIHFRKLAKIQFVKIENTLVTLLFYN
jgi:hypothetical protein